MGRTRVLKCSLNYPFRATRKELINAEARGLPPDSPKSISELKRRLSKLRGYGSKDRYKQTEYTVCSINDARYLRPATRTIHHIPLDKEGYPPHKLTSDTSKRNVIDVLEREWNIKRAFFAQGGFSWEHGPDEHKQYAFQLMLPFRRSKLGGLGLVLPELQSNMTMNAGNLNKAYLEREVYHFWNYYGIGQGSRGFFRNQLPPPYATLAASFAKPRRQYSVRGEVKEFYDITSHVEWLRSLGQDRFDAAGAYLYWPKYGDEFWGFEPVYESTEVDDRRKKPTTANFFTVNLGEGTEGGVSCPAEFQASVTSNDIIRSYIERVGVDELHSAIYKKLEQQIQTFDLGIYLGESAETGKLLVDLCKTVIRFIGALRNLNFKAALRAAKEFDAKGAYKLLRKLPRKSSEIYLWWQFGVMQFVKDVFDIIRTCGTIFDERLMFVVNYYQKPRVVEDFAWSAEHSVQPAFNAKSVSAEFSVKIKHYYKVGDSTQLFLAIFGLVQPIRTIIDLIPLSFIVDWFVPIKDYFTNFDPQELGLKFHAGTSSVKRVTTFRDDKLQDAAVISEFTRICPSELDLALWDPLMRDRLDSPTYSEIANFGIPYNKPILDKRFGLRGINSAGKAITLTAIATVLADKPRRPDLNGPIA